MSLNQVKIAGFKSFVDATTIKFPSKRVAIIGPNGCGKSNVIDAVRWVMGESSAKTLRGESMADVIFSGSANRAPVGLAAVELVFDNSEGRFGGEYAKYAEIAIRREVTQDGASNYFLNNTKCRRRDITDIFLGTGLGPRSYAIIGQGMISRIIEAKPDDLRVYLEEAAGISKYKERRRETENRIRHTRENLARLTDLREELDKQLDRLQRQAKAAERYQGYKKEQQQLKAELYVLRWQGLQQQSETLKKAFKQDEIELEVKVAELRRLDNAIEQFREVHQADNDAFNGVQEQYYKLSAEISRIEERIASGKERQQQLQTDLSQAERSKTHAKMHLAEDETKIATRRAELAQIEPEFQASETQLAEQKALLAKSEAALATWQQAWDAFNEAAAKVLQTAEVQQTDIQHIESQQQQLQQRLDHLTQQLTDIDIHQYDNMIDELQKAVDAVGVEEVQFRTKLDEGKQNLQTQRQEIQQIRQRLDEARRTLQQQQGRKASLEALQQVALGQQDETVNQWLESKGLKQQTRLAQTFSVSDGWEQAVELVLGDALQSICLDESSNIAQWLPELKQKSLGLNFFNPTQSTAVVSQSKASLTLLATKVKADEAVMQLFAHVYAAEDLSHAYQIQKELSAHESVVTQSGVWLKNGLTYVAGDEDPKAGMLKRAEVLQTLKRDIAQTEQQVDSLVNQEGATQQTLTQLETMVSEMQSNVASSAETRSQQAAELQIRKNQREQNIQRQTQLQTEQVELSTRQNEVNDRLTELREAWHSSLAQVEQHALNRATLQEQKLSLEQTLTKHKADYTKALTTHQQLSLRTQTLQTELQVTEQNLSRVKEQLADLAERHDTIQESIAASKAPIVSDQKILDSKLENQLDSEQNVSEAREKMEKSQRMLRQTEQQREQVDSDLQSRREHLAQQKMTAQALDVRQTTILEQLEELGEVLQTVMEQLTEEAEEELWAQRLEELDKRIQRLGAINLAAIDEFQTESERKRYLDEQNEDLEQALKTLENAIHKIDKETRARFKDTYDKVDNGLQDLFPRLFGGGQAHLELTGDDLLNTGVNIIARPPGKRNTSIHLLSGGEKALTAVALVFAIFQLNPSPFCMLDEVDAPLDDANVNRFCDLVKTMSEQVQFIFITHNKITMELAEQLMGVTMHEPGVSRIVSVDIEKAITLAEPVT